GRRFRAAGACQMLDHQAAGPPAPLPRRAVLSRRVVPRHGKPHEGWELLRLVEIAEPRLADTFAGKRDNALIALHVLAGIDGDGEMPTTEQRPLLYAFCGTDTFRVVARIGAQPSWRLVTDDEEIQEAVGLGLQGQLAIDLEGRAEHGGQRPRIAQRVREGCRCRVMRKDLVDRRSQTHQAADDARAYGTERQHEIVARRL